MADPIPPTATNPMHRGELFILGPHPGPGRPPSSTAFSAGDLGRCGSLAFSVSHTTRSPRCGEVPDEDYHFVDHETFQRMMANEEFLEWAEVHNDYYGTSNVEVFPRLEAGTDVLMDIDVQGAERVLARYPDANSIFIMPPSYDDLRERLRSRGLDEPHAISRRLAVSIWEIKRYDRYDHVIINDDAERASEALAAIILKRRHRRGRMEEAVQAVLGDFQSATRPAEEVPVGRDPSNGASRDRETTPGRPGGPRDAPPGMPPGLEPVATRTLTNRVVPVPASLRRASHQERIHGADTEQERSQREDGQQVPLCPRRRRARRAVAARRARQDRPGRGQPTGSPRSRSTGSWSTGATVRRRSKRPKSCSSWRARTARRSRSRPRSPGRPRTSPRTRRPKSTDGGRPSGRVGHAPRSPGLPGRDRLRELYLPEAAFGPARPAPDGPRRRVRRPRRHRRAPARPPPKDPATPAARRASRRRPRRSPPRTTPSRRRASAPPGSPRSPRRRPPVSAAACGAAATPSSSAAATPTPA